MKIPVGRKRKKDSPTCYQPNNWIWTMRRWVEPFWRTSCVGVSYVYGQLPGEDMPKRRTGTSHFRPHSLSALIISFFFWFSSCSFKKRRTIQAPCRSSPYPFFLLKSPYVCHVERSGNCKYAAVRILVHFDARWGVPTTLDFLLSSSVRPSATSFFSSLISLFYLCISFLRLIDQWKRKKAEIIASAGIERWSNAESIDSKYQGSESSKQGSQPQIHWKSQSSFIPGQTLANKSPLLVAKTTFNYVGSKATEYEFETRLEQEGRRRSWFVHDRMVYSLFFVWAHVWYLVLKSRIMEPALYLYLFFLREHNRGQVKGEENLRNTFTIELDWFKMVFY